MEAREVLEVYLDKGDFRVKDPYAKPSPWDLRIVEIPKSWIKPQPKRKKRLRDQ